MTTPSTGAGSSSMTTAASPAGYPQGLHLVRHQVMGLTAQFLLGMAVNLLGQPSETTGLARIASTVALAAHVLISLGMLAGAVLIIRAAARISRQWRTNAIWGGAGIAATITAGVLTMITKSNWWSYGMALGFIASLLSYGGLLLRPAPSPP